MLYVDDALIAANRQEDLHEFISQLQKEFLITPGDAMYFLGLEIEKKSNGDIKICQKSYAQKILERFSFIGSKPGRTPMLPFSESSKLGKALEKHNFPC